MVKHLAEANFYLAVKLQSELIIQAILEVASILRKKIKAEIEPKFYLRDSVKQLSHKKCPGSPTIAYLVI